MIITCPACDARYKIRDEQLGGSAKTITCRKCGHKFVVYPEGTKPEDQPSIPLAMQHSSKPFPTDDEEDAPTTIMSHGSSLAQQIREAVEESERKAAAGKAAATPPAPAAAAAAEGSSASFRRTLLWLGTVIVLLSALSAYILTF